MSAPMMSNEDYSLIKSFLIIPIVLSLFEHDSKIIGKFAMLKTPDPYVDVIEGRYAAGDHRSGGGTARYALPWDQSLRRGSYDKGDRSEVSMSRIPR